MAISYVGGVEGGRAGSTSTTTQSLSGTLTGGSNTSPSTGDLVVVLCAAGSDGTGTPGSQTISGNNSGAYTALTFQQTTTTTYDSSSQVNYKIMGTVDTSITIPSSANARNAQRWVVHVFRGVDSSTPLDVTSTYATGTATGRPNPALIAPSTAGAWICAFYASAASAGTAYTAPTDFATDWLGNTTADTADCMTGGGYYTGWTSGNYDPAAITAGGTTGANDSWTATTIALRPALPAFTQASYRFYEDGTETGATAIDTQDTNITRDVSGGDSNLQLRVRLQETNGNPGESTDDYQLQYELNDSGTYISVDQTFTFDGYPDTNQNNTYVVSATSVYRAGQSFEASSSGAVGSVGLYLKRTGSPTGNISAKLYTHSGTYGTSSVGDTLLETSNSIDITTISTSLAWVYFDFAGTTSLTAGTKYVVIVESNNGDVSNRLELGIDTTTPSHAGNLVNYNGSWSYSASYDCIFYVYSASGTEVIGYNSASLTDGNATTNRLGSGTGSFVAGEISEDGLVDNLTITASNYTELLYSLTIDSDAVVDADTLDFRVLRNGATTGMTYTVMPRITIEESAGGDYSVNKSESVTVTESVTVFKDTHEINKSDSITVTESVQRQAENFINKSDTSTLTESTKLETENRVNASDSSTITESLKLQPENRISVSDSSTITENHTVLIPELNVSVSDTTTLSESLKLETENFINKSDTATVTDTDTVSIAVDAEYNISKSESVTITESTKLETENRISIPEAISVTDASTVTIDNRVLSKTDNISISEGPGTASATATYYFNASVSGPTDIDTVWTDDANAFDGSTSTLAFTSTNGDTFDNYLAGTGTDAPGSGEAITQVRARVYGRGRSSSGYLYAHIDYSGDSLGTPYVFGNSVGWGGYDTLSTPTGGWTWTKVQNLTTTIYTSLGATNTGDAYRVEVEVTSGSAAKLEVESFVNKTENITTTENLVILVPDLYLAASDTVTATENTIVALAQYNVSVTDNITAAEQSSLLITELHITVEEAVSLDENIVVSQGVEAFYNVNKTEDVIVSESTTAVLSDALQSVSDSVSITESLKLEVESYITKTENVTVSESLVLFITELFSTNQDNVSITESLKLEGESTVNKSETATVSESIKLETDNRVNVSDGTTISESIKLETENTVNKTDSITVTENVDPETEYQITKNDTVTLGENTKQEIESFISKSDSTTVTENQTVLIPELLVNKSETVTTTESPIVFIPEYKVIETEDITLTEQLSLLIPELYVTVQESISTSENVLVNAGNQAFYNAQASESVAVSESVQIELSAVILNPTDNVTATESVTVTIQATDTPLIAKSESIAITESVTAQTTVDATTTDTVTMGESFKLETESSVTKSESVTITENNIVNFGAEISANDTVTLTEQITVRLSDNQVSVSDNLTVSENLAISKVQDIDLIVSQNVTITESVVADINSNVVTYPRLIVTIEGDFLLRAGNSKLYIPL